MVTSRSTEKTKDWTAGAIIFSGRPDPTWTINAETARELQQVWINLQPWSGKAPSAPPLGYRGCFLRSGEGREWFVFGGMVTRKGVGGSESRLDKEHFFEKLLLNSAPPGLLPASFLK